MEGFRIDLKAGQRCYNAITTIGRARRRRVLKYVLRIALEDNSATMLPRRM